MVIQTTVSPVFHYFSCYSKLEDQKRAAFHLMHSWRYPGSFLQLVRNFSAGWIDFLKSVSIAHDYDLPVSEPVQTEQFCFTCQFKHSYPFCGTFPECNDCDLPVSEPDLIIPVELPVVVQPKSHQELRVYDKSLEIFEPLPPLNFDALQVVLEQFVHWFLACPYSRSTNEKKRVFDEFVSSVSNEFNLTPPQSKNYFWNVRQRLELLP